MATVMRVIEPINQDVVIHLEFAHRKGEPNKEFALALNGDPRATFGAGTAKILRDLFQSMYPGAEIKVEHNPTSVIVDDRRGFATEEDRNDFDTRR